MSVVEGRFKIDKVEPFSGEGPGGFVELSAAYNDGVGNEDWSQWTPSGSIKMAVTVKLTYEWYQARVGQVIRIRMDEVPRAEGSLL